ncbi:hypothetical protein, partial [Vibrio cholerae]|uniref:hypothetical protein n=1 Tax=Vibrio cholerae TaxID=666 RepID=UPI002F9173B5
NAFVQFLRMPYLLPQEFKSEVYDQLHLLTRIFSEKVHNARLRGWQRINTKLKHNNHNHRGSMGLETPRVDSPS